MNLKNPYNALTKLLKNKLDKAKESYNEKILDGFKNNRINGILSIRK